MEVSPEEYFYVIIRKLRLVIGMMTVGAIETVVSPWWKRYGLISGQEVEIRVSE